MQGVSFCSRASVASSVFLGAFHAFGEKFWSKHSSGAGGEGDASCLSSVCSKCVVQEENAYLLE